MSPGLCGWCLTGRHESCKDETLTGELCNCICHEIDFAAYAEELREQHVGANAA
jgi:hypothetical protein